MRGFNFDGTEALIFSRRAEFLENDLLRMNWVLWQMVVKMLCKQSNVVQIMADGYMGLPTLCPLGKLSIPCTDMIIVNFHRTQRQFPEKKKKTSSLNKRKNDSA